MPQTKIVLIGAGSASFGLSTLRGLMTQHQDLAGSTIALVDLDEAALKKYFSARAPGVLEQADITLEALAVGQKFAVRTGRGAQVVPTVAGCVLFGSHPEWLQPSWRVTALRFSGVEITAPIVDRLPPGSIERREAVRIPSFAETGRTEESVIFQDLVALPPGTYVVAVEARDALGSRGFRAQDTLEVPAYGAAGRRLATACGTTTFRVIVVTTSLWPSFLKTTV